MKDTEFVFLIPAYNCEKEIKKTLMSVFSQSYDNWRIILIDDVSTDNTTTSLSAIHLISSTVFLTSPYFSSLRINITLFL